MLSPESRRADGCLAGILMVVPVMMAEACKYLGGISRPTLYKLILEGAITSLHIGVRRYFPVESLNTFIDERIGLFPEVDDMIENDVNSERGGLGHRDLQAGGQGASVTPITQLSHTDCGIIFHFIR